MAEAKSLLQQAGFGPDNPLKLELSYNTSENHKRIAVAIQSMWKQLGVQAELVNREVKVHYDVMKQNKFDIARAAWVADYNDPQDFLYLLETRTGVAELWPVQQSRVRRADAGAGQERDPTGSSCDLMKQAERIAMTEDAWLPDLLLRVQEPGLAEGRGLRDQHQAGASLALGLHQGVGAVDVAPDPASAGDRRADAADHHHAQLLHDAAGAGRAVRPGAAAAAGDPRATSRGPTISTSRWCSSTCAIWAALLRGDFGPSYRTKDFTVGQLLVEGAPASFKVGGLAVAAGHASWACSPASSRRCARTAGRTTAVMALAMVGIAIPSFVMAPLLTLVFGVYLGWLPVGGWGGGALPFLILPVVSLALPQVAQSRG